MQLKKSLGQHFLKNKNIASRIVNALYEEADVPDHIVEIGPGSGILTDFLYIKAKNLTLIELDKRLIENLENKYPKATIIQADVLRYDWKKIPSDRFAVIGNFPYNISSQIIFKVLENYKRIPYMVGMFQKEMAKRVSSGPGSKEYGVISVLSQFYYETQYLFDVDRGEFTPPPAVQSGILKFFLKNDATIPENVSLIRRIVKQSFNQRRKTLRNSLKNMIPKDIITDEFFNKRPEQLSLNEFVELSKRLDETN
ncbi:MAG: ribosomal RNA small subunit methyltransferase A [Chitinophagaceae bacterium]|nr:MAG: ribosomal RNA small subunit methyltransferase A [Chitinophagaceae bacterium]